MRSIAFFDFDGTVTKGDSFLRFLFFKRRVNAVLCLQVMRSLPVLAAWKTGIMDNNKAKEKIFAIFFKGTDAKMYENNCVVFANTVLRCMTRKDAMEKIEWHRSQQHHIVIVSASVESYIAHFAGSIAVEYIATGIEISNEKLTGNFSGNNCYGPEKANRIKKQYQLDQYDVIYAYGDTRGDKEMLALAHKPYYRYFHG